MPGGFAARGPADTALDDRGIDMSKITLSVAACAAMFIAAHPAPVLAQPAKVWVSSAGGDSPSCGDVTALCRRFQQAHDNVAAGGEISVLDPGDYGGFNSLQNLRISKSVSISNDGAGEATILTTGIGIEVAATIGDVVTLRGLIIDGSSSANMGIQLFSAAALHVQNCVIRNIGKDFVGTAIEFLPSSNSELLMSDSVVYNNGTAADTGGIHIAPRGIGSARVVLERVHIENNVFGIKVDGTRSTGAGSRVVLRDSVVAGNVASGIIAYTIAGGAPSLIEVDQSTTVDNGQDGILADGPRAVVLLNNSTITRNGTGVATANGGQLISYRNNRNNNNIGAEGTATGFLARF